MLSLYIRSRLREGWKWKSCPAFLRDRLLRPFASLGCSEQPDPRFFTEGHAQMKEIIIRLLIILRVIC